MVSSFPFGYFARFAGIKMILARGALDQLGFLFS